MSAADALSEDRIAAVRGFNRFYTQRIGVLRRRMYGSPLSLAEVRVLYELAHRDAPTASELADELDLDRGYLSRILQGFERDGLLRRSRSDDDGRASHLALTPKGRKAFAPIDRASHDEIARLLAHLSDGDARHLVDSMTTIEGLLAGSPSVPPTVTLRTHRPGDIGWVIERHGAVYAQELDWDETFEGLVAEIAGKFLLKFDPAKERCWIAERNGERVGCVFVVKRSPTVAQLRLLLVEPSARGLGIGARLVDECLAFAREAGYRRMVLWTNGGLDAARAIYEARGFQLVKEERHHSFGHDLVGQTFERAL
jgi:DNA-binding MarR family transcriptional regulator/N-acetylglutamate synthase-like GNAT family acetyltransferase